MSRQAAILGSALTLQTSLGYLISLSTIHAVPRIVEGPGWPWAFCALAIGPALGIVAIRRFARLQSFARAIKQTV